MYNLLLHDDVKFDLVCKDQANLPKTGYMYELSIWLESARLAILQLILLAIIVGKRSPTNREKNWVVIWQ